MLSSDEQRAWDEIRRRCAEEVEEPARPVLDTTDRRPRSPAPASLLATVVAGGCLAVLLVVCGAPLAGLAVAVAVAPRWLLWRYWSLLDGIAGPSAPTATRDVPLDGGGHPSSGAGARSGPASGEPHQALARGDAGRRRAGAGVPSGRRRLRVEQLPRGPRPPSRIG